MKLPVKLAILVAIVAFGPIGFSLAQTPKSKSTAQVRAGGATSSGFNARRSSAWLGGALLQREP